MKPFLATKRPRQEFISCVLITSVARELRGVFAWISFMWPEDPVVYFNPPVPLVVCAWKSTHFPVVLWMVIGILSSGMPWWPSLSLWHPQLEASKKPSKRDVAMAPQRTPTPVRTVFHRDQQSVFAKWWPGHWFFSVPNKQQGMTWRWLPLEVEPFIPQPTPWWSTSAVTPSLQLDGLDAA